jgi:gliding motility-associated-like protein
MRGFSLLKITKRSGLLLAVLLLSAVTVSAQTYNVTICSGETLNFTPTPLGPPTTEQYKWALPSQTGFTDATAQSTFQNSVNQTINNSSNVSRQVTYTVLSSTGLFNFTLVVTVNPTPTFTSSLATTSICSGGNFSFSTASPVAGTAATWTRAATANIIPGSSSGTGDIIEALTNTSINPASATYTISLTATGCGNTQNVSVIVNPLPTINNTAPGTVCSGIPFVFAASSGQSPVSFQWSRAIVTNISNTTGSASSNSINETLVNTSTAAVPVDYIYKLTNGSTGCFRFETVSVSVIPTPTLTSATTLAVCSGSVLIYNPTSSLTGSNFDWTRAATPNITPNSSFGNGSVNETLVNTGTAFATPTYVYVVSKAGCSSTQNVVATVNPLPAMSSTLNPAALCSGITFNYTPTSLQDPNVNYSWTRATMPGISNTGTSNTLPISEALINTTNATISVLYTYTLTNSLTTCANTQNLFIDINPIPTVSSYTLSMCNNLGFASAPAGAPAGTSFTWVTPAVNPGGVVTSDIPGITPLAAQTAPQLFVNQPLLHNSSGAPADVTYTVKPNLGGCIGSDFTVVVTVLNTSTPVDISSNLGVSPFCSGIPSNFNYIVRSSSSPAIFTWQRSFVTGITNAANSGSGVPDPLASAPANSIIETLVNNTAAQVTTYYAITIKETVSGCTNGFIIGAPVNPVATMTSSLTPVAICSNTVFNYTPVANVPSTTFGWTRGSVTGISPGTTFGTNSPGETLINTTTAPISVNYVYTLSTPAFCTSSATVVLTVNPAPVLSSAITTTGVCSGSPFTYTATSATTGTVFNWSRSLAANISNTAATGFNNIVHETLINTSATTASVVYDFSLLANGCTNPQTVTIPILPLPSVTNKSDVICTNTSFSIAPTGVPAGTQYTWPTPVSVAPGVVTGGSAATLQNTIGQALLNTTTASGILYYTVTPVANGCPGLDFTVDVTVNPKPVISSPVTIAAVCSGSAFTYTPPAVPSTTTYTWSAPTSSPIGGLTGGGALSNQSVISQTLFSTGTAAATASYTIIPVSTGCIGSTFTLNVPVNPLPIVASPISTAVCSGNAFTATISGVPAGTTYTWVTPTVTPFGTVVGADPQSTPVSTISQVLTNNTSSSAQSLYTIIPVSGTCAGGAFSLDVTINPSTQLSSSLTPPAICSGATFNYTPTSNTSGTSFAWGRSIVAGISNGAASGSGNPLEVLSNVTPAAPVTVTYVYSLVTAAGCTNSQTVTVVTNPTPTLSNATLTPADVCSGSLFSFAPTSNTTGTTFNWTRATITNITNPGTSGTNNPGENLVNVSLAPIQVSYDYLLNANGCSNNQLVKVFINPIPVAASQALSICSNTAFTVAPSGVPAATTYTWGTPVSNPVSVVNNGTSQATPQTNISQTLTNTTLTPGTLTYTTIPTASGCAGQAFTITVNVSPIPTANNAPLAAICSGNAFSYTPSTVPTGTTFSWNVPVLTPLSGLTGGSQASLQSSISQTLTSSNNIANTAVYTVTPLYNGCQGSTFDVTVPVNPVPVVGGQSVDICSGNTFTVSPSSVPVGTNYTWVTPVSNPGGTVSGATPQSTPASNISQLLTSSSTNAVQAFYTVVPATSTCTGNAFTVTVGVNPSTALSTSITPPAICSNTVFNYPAASNTPSTSIFSWTRAAVSGISNTARSSAGNPNETLVNTTASPVSVVYAYTLSTTAGCSNSQNVTVVVNPTPVLNPQTINAVCSGINFFTYTPASATTGTTFTWNRLAVTSITNPALSGTGDPNELLVNTSLNIIPVTYDYTLAANGCSNIQSIVVNVNPIPVVNDQVAIICSNTSFSVAPANVPSGTRYSWPAAASTPVNVVTGGSAGSLQNAISGTLTNATISSATDLYTVTPVANGCSGNAFSVTVTVKPIPVAANQAITAVCSGATFSYTPASIPVNTKYSWGSPSLNPSQGLTGGSAASVQNAVSQTLSSTNNVSNTAVYIVTPVADGCIGNTFQVTVPVNPVPVVNNQALAICSGNAFTVTPTSVPVGTQYTWAIPVQTPNGSVAGSSAQAIPQSTISQILNNTTTAAVQTLYTVTPAVNGCTGNNFTITVGVNPGTQLNLSVTPAALCSNTQFSYLAASNTPGTVFQWTRAIVAGISNTARSGTNDPLETLFNITTQAITVTYAYSLTTPAGCTDNETVSVRVNPTPSLTSLHNPPAICSGTQFNYNPVASMTGTSFAWNRSSVAFISNTASSGTNNPAEFLVNTSVNSVNTFYDYTMTAAGCSNTERITVAVSATPTIANQSTATCSNVAFDYSPTNVPTNTAYTWTAPTINPVGSVSGGSAEPSGQPRISQLLINQSLNAAVARYRVTPAAGVCTGADFFVDVTLNPAATISNQTLAAVCSGTPFSYTPSNVPVNTVYTWSTPVISPGGSLTGGGAEAVSKLLISQTLNSTNNIVDNAVYTVTPSTNGCLGQTFTLSVFVNPTPSVANMKDTICTSSSFTLTSASPVPSNTLYTWTAPQIFPFGSVIGATPQPSPAPTISQTLFNTTTAQGQAIYTVTPQASGCVGNSFTLAVVVGAVLPAIPNQTATVCSGSAFNATPGSQSPGTTYTWGTPVVTPAGSVTGISAANTPQVTVSQLLDNLLTNNSTVVYTVAAKNNGCVSNNFTATITVLPVPRTFVTGNAEICRYPLDTLTINFTGAAPWGFTYFDGTTGTPHVVTGIGTSPYKLVVPSSPQASRTFAFLNASHNGCTNSKDTVYFAQIINSLPVGVIHSLHGAYICNNISDTMFVTSPETLTYQWTRNGTTIAGAINDSIASNIPGRYNVMMTNQYGCKDTAAVFQPKIYISQPVLRLLYDTYCINTQMNLTNITDTNLTGPTTWAWTFDNGASNTLKSGFHSSVTFTTGGDHHIRLTATQLYCPAYPTTIDTTVNINFPIAGVTMPSMSAYKGTSTPISVRSIPNYKYRWTPPYGINNPDSSNTLFNNQNTQQYVINLISPAGCVTHDSLLVRVFEDKLVEIMIPKSFTPNGDGINDILYPYLSGIKEFKYFKVYNRFNQLMFETKNHDVGWNGTLNGTPQPMAIYIWVAVGVALDGTTVERKGQVLLLR